MPNYISQMIFQNNLTPIIANVSLYLSDTYQYAWVSDIWPRKIPPTHLKKGGLVPSFLRWVREDQALTKLY